jgi:hypothetical protein
MATADAQQVYSAWTAAGQAENVLALPPVNVDSLPLGECLLPFIVAMLRPVVDFAVERGLERPSRGLSSYEATAVGHPRSLLSQWQALLDDAKKRDPAGYLRFQANWPVFLNDVVELLARGHAWPSRGRGVLALFLLDVPKNRMRAVRRAVARCQHPRLCLVLGMEEAPCTEKAPCPDKASCDIDEIRCWVENAEATKDDYVVLTVRVENGLRTTIRIDSLQATPVICMDAKQPVFMLAPLSQVESDVCAVLVRALCQVAVKCWVKVPAEVLAALAKREQQHLVIYNVVGHVDVSGVSGSWRQSRAVEVKCYSGRMVDLPSLRAEASP